MPKLEKTNGVYDLDKVAEAKEILVQATPSQLNALLKEFGNDGDKYVDEKGKNNLVTLVLPQIKRNTSRLLKNITVGELSGKDTKSESILDFSKSENFYKKAKSLKIKIIRDAYSDLRNMSLYEGFNLIETMWRQLVAENFEDSYIQPKEYKSKEIDHKVSQYVFSEFLESFFYSPASEKYKRERWKGSDKTEDDFIKLSELRKLDELEFPLNYSELTELNKARNRCMHFRTTTVEDYIKSVDLINKYILYSKQKEFGKHFKLYLDSYIEISETLTKTLQDTFKSFQNINLKLELPDITFKLPDIPWPYK